MANITITGLRGREIINGRGIPAVEVDLFASNGARYTASAPSGVSVSSHEAVEIRDGGTRLMGKGVLQAARNVSEKIAPALIGKPVTDQTGLDALLIELDGTKQKTALGGNALTAVSLAIAKAGAAASGLEPYAYLGGTERTRVPLLCPNMLSGSKTAGNSLDFEDYLLAPFGFPTLAEAIAASVETFHVLHKNLHRKYGLIPQITALAPPCKTSKEAMDFIVEAIAEAGYEGKIGLGVDVAADNFYDAKTGLYNLQSGPVDRADLIAHYRELTDNYPILFWEDGLAEDDFEGFAAMTKAVPVLIVGDDLFATNPERLAQGAAIQAANAMLLKV
ncbi:phosphopyruvate hydratase, partial [Desulfovibrio sp. OttesenSCG-928-O18]|nr:phosphopyruvate hydratase [Desulfovibrio sp. OttesenSCG-928-O18]